MTIYFIFAINTFNGISMQAARVVLALYALDLGAQPLTIGILGATFSICPALLAVPTGKLSDRYGSRWLVVIGTLGGGLGLLVPYFFPGLGSIFAAGIMIGFLAAISNVSLQNLVGVLSTPENRAKNYSNYSLVNATSNFLGPLLAGYSVQHAGHALACVLLALFTLVPMVLMSVWGHVLPRGTPSRERARGGLMATLSVPGARRILAAGSLQNVAESLFIYYMPVYMHALGLAASTIGIVLAMNSAAAFVVRLVLPKAISRLGEERVLAYAFYMGAVALLLVPFFKYALILGVLSFIFGLGMGGCGPIVTMLMFTNSLPGRSGEAMGLKVTVNHLTKVIGPVAFGFLASAFGLSPVFWIDALMLGTGGMLSFSRKRR